MYVTLLVKHRHNDNGALHKVRTMHDGAISSAQTGGDLNRRERRRLAMIDAGRRLFLERGYEAVTLAEVVRLSGGSLSTLYELFESKAGLLAAVMTDHRFGMTESIDRAVAKGGAPAVQLRAIARAITADLAAPETLGLIRIVMAESLRDPAIGRWIYHAVHRTSANRLVDLFAEWREAGLADIPDADRAARMLFGLILSGMQARILYGDQAECEFAERVAMADEAVGLLVRGYNIATVEPA